MMMYCIKSFCVSTVRSIVNFPLLHQWSWFHKKLLKWGFSHGHGFEKRTDGFWKNDGQIYSNLSWLKKRRICMPNCNFSVKNDGSEGVCNKRRITWPTGHAQLYPSFFKLASSFFTELGWQWLLDPLRHNISSWVVQNTNSEWSRGICFLIILIIMLRTQTIKKKLLPFLYFHTECVYLMNR